MPLTFDVPELPTPLVGRSEEVAEVAGALCSAGADGSLVVVVGGGGGDGQDLDPRCRPELARAREPGLLVYRATAEQMDRHRPIGLVADCLGLDPGSATALVADLAERLLRTLPAPGGGDLAALDNQAQRVRPQTP